MSRTSADAMYAKSLGIDATRVIRMFVEGASAATGAGVNVATVAAALAGGLEGTVRVEQERNITAMAISANECRGRSSLFTAPPGAEPRGRRALSSSWSI
jgi:hypothetical protein